VFWAFGNIVTSILFVRMSTATSKACESADYYRQATLCELWVNQANATTSETAARERLNICAPAAK
jgi:hypothetical protein